MKNILIVMMICISIGCASEYPGQVDSNDGVQGETGATGVAGATGAQGLPGQSCTVAQNALGALLTCPDGTTALVLHGKHTHSDKKCKKHHDED